MLSTRESLAEYTEKRLREWGSWARKERLSGKYIGNIEMIQKNGGVFVKFSGFKKLHENKNAEELDRCILMLKKIHIAEATALISYYTSQASKHEVAEKLRMSRRRLDDCLSKAKFWVECELSRKLDS